MEDYKYLFKVVLIGNAGVGKTCLVRRFTQGLFPPGQGATIGVDFMIKTVQIGDDKVKLQIWDTAGQERFRSITQSYYRSADALVVVYDVTSFESFRCLPDWIKEIEQYASNKAITVLVGNKTDLIEDREVSLDNGTNFASTHEMRFLETSAKEADNVDKLFLDIAEELTKRVQVHEVEDSKDEIAICSQNHTVSATYNCCRW
ncbi:ras-related protein Rab-30-like [Saccoglossus kowalevskii]